MYSISQQTIPSSISRASGYKNLVFAGGSVKGIAYVGAFEVFAKQCDISQLKRVAGTSAGSIFALLVALGFGVDEMRSILAEFKFAEILDSTTSNYKPMSNAEKLLTTVEKQARDAPFAKMPAATGALPMVWQLHQKLGLFEGEYFREWAENLIRKQVQRITDGTHNGEHLTFTELAKLSTQYPALRQLYVVGVNLNLAQAVTFSADNPNTSDVIISDAIRISMSIPFIFEPHRIYRNIDGQRRPDAVTQTWIDGGWLRNYPLDIFDDIDPPEQTLGFNLVDERIENYLSGLNPLPQSATNNLLQYAGALFKSTLRQQKTAFALSVVDQARTVSIPSMGIDTLAFNLTQEQQQQLISSGYSTTAAFFGISTERQFISNDAILIENLPQTTSTSHSIQQQRSLPMSSNPHQSSPISSLSSFSGYSSYGLNPDNYVMVNIWTGADDKYIPGHNVGHVSIQTRDAYYSLWPTPRAQSEHVSRDSLSKMGRKTRDVTKYFSARPVNYIPGYNIDCLLEGASEDNYISYEASSTAPSEGFCLAIYNKDTGRLREATERPPQLQLDEDEVLFWVKPIEANVRLSFYSLDVGRIHNEFKALRNTVEGWSMAGSNLLQQILGSKTNESCATLAYRLLSAGNFQSLLSLSQRTRLCSQTSSFVEPGALAIRAYEAKCKERTQAETAITANWHMSGESDLENLRQCYEPGSNTKAKETLGSSIRLGAGAM